MTMLKTTTTALTAAVLVTGIGLAWAQTDTATPQPSDTTAVAPQPTPTAADPSAVPPASPRADGTDAATGANPATATDDLQRTTPLPSDARNTTDTPATDRPASMTGNEATTSRDDAASRGLRSADGSPDATLQRSPAATSGDATLAPRSDRN